MLEEARKRSNKTFILGSAESLSLDDFSFDAVFYVTTLEFIDDYQKTIRESYRVTKSNGKILIMMLNPGLEYFYGHILREGSYFKRIKYINLQNVRDYISNFYRITKEKYFLGIKGQQIFDTSDKRFASLYVIVGWKNYYKI